VQSGVFVLNLLPLLLAPGGGAEFEPEIRQKARFPKRPISKIPRFQKRPKSPEQPKYSQRIQDGPEMPISSTALEMPGPEGR
jgi:hypothetical protein